jgi:hypothetical protein
LVGLENGVFFIFVSLASNIIELLSSSFSFPKMLKEERKLRSKLNLEFPP